MGINSNTCSGFYRFLGMNSLRGLLVCLISLYDLVYVYLLCPCVLFPYACVLFDMLVGLLSSIFFLKILCLFTYIDNAGLIVLFEKSECD